MSQIQTVKDANEIVEIIGERLDLHKAGGHFRALCPFHSEKSPSFFVNQSMQRYKCFGCGESGDVITFLEKYEGMTFVEALEYLAERAGITLERLTRTSQDDERKDLLAVLDLAKEYYHYLLTKHRQGEEARAYLKSRQIKAQSVKLFQIGYSLPAWDALFKYLNGKKKFAPELLLKAGLVARADSGRYYDRFRGRLMFPLRNHRGQVVGFSGRVLDPDVKEAKYINSPETSLYHKKEMLFGYSELLQSIRQQKTIVIVEGELDVIASTQAHVNNVAAVKGSALTADHVKLIKRVATKVVLSLDKDSAGVEATKKAIELLGEAELDLRVTVLPGGKDPDELVKTDPAAWREAVKQSISGYAYLIDQAFSSHDPGTGEGRRQIMRELGPVVAAIPHKVEQEFYVGKIAKRLSVKESYVWDDVRLAGREARAKLTRPKAGASSAAVGASAQPSAAGGGTVAAGGSAHSRATSDPARPSAARRARLEEYLVFLLLQLKNDNKLTSAELSDLVALEKLGWANKSLAKLVKTVTEKPELTLEKLSKTLSGDQAELLFSCFHQPDFLAQSESVSLKKEWRDVLGQLLDQATKERIEEISALLRQFDQEASLSQSQEAEQQKLLSEIATLKSPRSQKQVAD